jgi:hypothetical protein
VCQIENQTPDTLFGFPMHCLLFAVLAEFVEFQALAVVGGGAFLVAARLIVQVFAHRAL